MYSVSEVTGQKVLASVNRMNISGFTAADIDSDTTGNGAASIVERAHRKFTESAANIGLNLGTTTDTNTDLINLALVLYVAAEFSKEGLPKVNEDCRAEECQYRSEWLGKSCTLLKETKTGMAEATGVCEAAKEGHLPDIFNSSLYEQC